MSEFHLEYEVFGPYNNMNGTLSPADKVDLKLVLSLAETIYNTSVPVGMGFLQNFSEPLGDSEVKFITDIWNEQGKLRMDYVNGRQCKFDIQKPWFPKDQQPVEPVNYFNVFFGDKPNPVERLQKAFEKAGHVLTVSQKVKVEEKV